jgi:hypothetical protein
MTSRIGGEINVSFVFCQSDCLDQLLVVLYTTQRVAVYLNLSITQPVGGRTKVRDNKCYCWGWWRCIDESLRDNLRAYVCCSFVFPSVGGWFAANQIDTIPQVQPTPPLF